MDYRIPPQKPVACVRYENKDKPCENLMSGKSTSPVVSFLDCFAEFKNESRRNSGATLPFSNTTSPASGTAQYYVGATGSTGNNSNNS